MSAKGYCYDNAFAESFFATLKAESFPHDGVFPSKLEARRAIFATTAGASTVRSDTSPRKWSFKTTSKTKN
jgi:hypothetical protein